MNFTKEQLHEIISAIGSTDDKAEAAARERLDNLVKPPGSLGVLENISAKLSAITGDLYPDIGKRCVLVMSSDNGVVEEGVASAPQSVTEMMTINFTRGITGVAVLAKAFNADLFVYDLGVNADISNPSIIDKKIRKSTDNIAKGPAMTYDEALQAIGVGIEAAISAADMGYKLIGVGEMGIGNTTTSSAVLCSLLGIKGDETSKTVGRGAGLLEKDYKRKIELIANAVDSQKPLISDPVDILHKVGGFDIAAMTGAYLGAAYKKIPVVIDGFISIVAALCAARLAPISREYMFASHNSEERGYVLACNEIGLFPSLQLNMRLGEGSGCPIMFSIMDASCAIMKNMGTFAEASIDSEYLENITGKDAF